MSAEIICVGTELLLGDILNSNSRYLARELADLGIAHYYQTVVGDNPDRIKKAIAIAVDRAEILIFTGGLGPTPDDLTVATIADFFKTPLSERPEIIADIEAKYARRGRKMTTSDRKQAQLPVGADILPNAKGSAPGIIWQPQANVTILTFPGVPTEMEQMWRTTAVPFLKSQGWGQATVCSRMLKFWGLREVELAEKVAEFLALENPTVAPYANWGEVKLRISARAATPEAARDLMAPVEEKLRHIAGEDCFGADEDTLATVVGQLLRDRGQTLAVAESCTGGGLGHMLTEVPGSSDYFLGGAIAYANAVKVALLGVDAGMLERQGAVSAEVAAAMAAGVRDKFDSDWGLSITGVAGPGGGTDSKPVGLVYIGVAGPGGQCHSEEYRFGSDRDREWIRHLSACSALDGLRRKLL